MNLKNDWLLCGSYKSEIFENGNELIMTNGIVSRTFIKSPDFACISMINHVSDCEFLRSITPALELTINGTLYKAGGVGGQSELGFLKREWLKDFFSDAEFKFDSYTIDEPSEKIKWNRTRHAPNTVYPLKGKRLCVNFTMQSPINMSLIIYYEIYDNLPIFAKYFKLNNNNGEEVLLDSFIAENLRLVEGEGVDGFFSTTSISCITQPTRIETDKEYTSQVNWTYSTPCKFISAPRIGPHRRISDNGSFESYVTYEMLFDTSDKERRMMELCRFYASVTPWCTENPIYLHVVSVDEKIVKTAIDQCVECGFEMVILSFGSGLDMELTSDENIDKFRKLADYAHERGIQLGGYSLLASRRIDDENDVVNDKIIFDHSPCLGSKWGIKYFKNLRMFIERTGFDVLEHDGSYPGDSCASTKHPGHECYEDSQYNQLTAITEFYAWCRSKGIYLNIPDNYFAAGNNKTAMGYREVNWSLPRELQRVIARKNIYDGTYIMLPSMGWMFVPLTEYHGGGEAATIEPLCEHLHHYKIMLYNNLLAGVQASYRGIRLYDTEETKQMVKTALTIYKKYRDILESPAIHIRRADGRDYDGYVHCNPLLDIKGFAVFFNPCENALRRKVTVPLYYSGLNDAVTVSLFDEKPQKYSLDSNHNIELDIEIPPDDFIWYTIKAIYQPKTNHCLY